MPEGTYHFPRGFYGARQPPPIRLKVTTPTTTGIAGNKHPARLSIMTNPAWPAIGGADAGRKI